MLITIITEIFAKVFNMSLAASAVILTVILLRLLLKRAPKIFSYLLWTTVIFRLLCPFTPVLPFGITPLQLDITENAALNSPLGNLFEKTIETNEIPQVPNATEQIVERSETQPAVTTNYTNEDPYPITEENIKEEVPKNTEITAEQKIILKNKKEPFVLNILVCVSFVWFIGVIAMILWGIISYIRLEQKLKNSECLREIFTLQKP